MSSVKMQELTQDIDELKLLLSQATRARVKDILSLAIRKLETDLITLKTVEDAKRISLDDNAVKVNWKKDICYDTKITNYAWDQSEKFVKLYITLKNVHTIPEENFKCDFTAKSMDLSVKGLDGKNHTLLITNLLYPILPDASYYKVKTDQVLVMLKKEAVKEWASVTILENKAKDNKTPKLDEDVDPSRGLMDLMKKMYDEGDDDMKRNIAKAWTESREKAQTDMHE